MSIQGIPAPQDLLDDVLIFGAIGPDGMTAHAVRRSTREACCTACGGHARLDLQDVGSGMRAVLCAPCRVAFHQHGVEATGDIASC